MLIDKYLGAYSWIIFKPIWRIISFYASFNAFMAFLWNICLFSINFCFRVNFWLYKIRILTVKRDLVLFSWFYQVRLIVSILIISELIRRFLIMSQNAISFMLSKAIIINFIRTGLMKSLGRTYILCLLWVRVKRGSR